MDNKIEEIKLALNFQKKGEINEAKKIFKKYLNSDDSNLQINFYYGTLEAITGNYESSLLYFDKAEKINNKNPDLYNNYGMSLKILGKLDDAILKINQAIELNPKFTNAFFNLAEIFIEKEDFENAILNLEKSIDFDRNFIKAYTLLAVAYHKIGDSKKSEIIFQNAYKINPKYLPLYLNFGNICLSLGKIAKAEECFIHATNLDNKYFDAYNNLFDLYEKTNQNEKLHNILSKAEKIFTNNKIIKLFRGAYNYKIKEYFKSIEILENISFDKKDINRERLKYLILAKAHDHLDDVDKAFNYFKITNQINEINKNKIKNIDKYQPLKSIDDRCKYIDTFLTDKNIKKKIYSEDKTIFMIGFPRSGTTLLDTILRSHPQIEVLEEKPLVSNLLQIINKKTFNNFNNFKDFTDQDILSLREKYFFERNKLSNNKKFIIDKMPLNLMHIVELNKIFPEAKYIVSIRHPFDCVLSSYMQSFEMNNSMANFLNLIDSAKFYDLVMSLWEKGKQKINLDYIEIKYEEIIINFNHTISKLLEFLELPWSDTVNEFYLTAQNRSLISTPSYDQVNQPLYKKSLNRWKKYNKHIDEIKPILNSWAKKFNYEN